MTYTIQCEKCEKELDIRGYAGHLRMSHGIHGEDMKELVEKKKEYIPPSRKPENRRKNEPEERESEVIANEDNSVHTHVCTMCGKPDDVETTDKIAQLFKQRGHRVPEELHKYDLYCVDCEYAFKEGGY